MASAPAGGRAPVPSGVGRATAGPSTLDRTPPILSPPQPGAASVGGRAQPSEDRPCALERRCASGDGVALIAGFAVLVHRLLPTGSLPQNLVYDGIGMAAVAAIVAGVLIYRPERPQPWLLAAGQPLFVTGDAPVDDPRADGRVALPVDRRRRLSPATRCSSSRS